MMKETCALGGVYALLQHIRCLPENIPFSILIQILFALFV